VTGSGADEFALIARFFAPLATTPAARGLLDDAAVAQLAGPTVLTVDALVEGVHFLASDPLDTVAQKALRVNLSDLAAKGARPLGYLLTLAWPAPRPTDDIALLAEGLARDQAAFGLALWGGDTVATPGPLILSVTMIGAAAPSGGPARAGARPGDDVWIAGVIGDGVLGLEAARGGAGDLAERHRAHLIEHYRRPTPQLWAADAVAAHATASMDVSDGLLGDAAKIASASGVEIELLAAAIPVSEAGAAWIMRQSDPGAARALLASGGDDYALLFTADPAARAAIAGTGAHRVGRCGVGAGVRVLDAAGGELAWPIKGYTHSFPPPGNLQARKFGAVKADNRSLPMPLLRALFLCLALAISVAPAALAAKPKAEEAVAIAPSMDQALIVVPVVREGRLVNYLFVSMRLELAGGDVFKHQEKAHFVREALLFASHKAPLHDLQDSKKLNEAVAKAEFLAAARGVLGEKSVAGVKITSVHSLK
jgi:thiamine-monophosphate kinase